MRLLLILFFLVLSQPLFAWDIPDWERYYNGRFDYSIGIPPGFHGRGESDNGDGQSFLAEDLTARLTVWGGHIINDGDFQQEVLWHIKMDMESGWNISYQAIRPQWVSYSGTKGYRILYKRIILLCNGFSAATFHLEYDQGDKAKFDPIINELVQTFTAHNTGWQTRESVVTEVINIPESCDQSAWPKPQSHR